MLDYVDEVSSAFNFSRHDAVNMLGSLQLHGNNIPNVTLGHPNEAYWSPKDLIRSNCLHPTDQGFQDIFNNLWDVYFSHV